MGAERDELTGPRLLPGRHKSRPGTRPQLLTITFCLDGGSGTEGATRVKVEPGVGLHLIRGYEFWSDRGMCCNYNTTQRMCKLSSDLGS